LYKRVANTIDAILRGAKPGDIPIYQVTKFELSINLKTAKQLGLSVPPALVAIADKVIEWMSKGPVMAGPLADFIRRDFRFRPLADLGIHSRVGRRLAAIVAADVAGYSRQVRGKVAVEFPVAVSTSCPVMRTPSIAVLPFTNMSGIIGDDIRSRILTDAVADRRLLEMLSINCHRAFIAKALDRTEMEIRERVGVLKALRASGENFMGCLAAADEMPAAIRDGSAKPIQKATMPAPVVPQAHPVPSADVGHRRPAGARRQRHPPAPHWRGWLTRQDTAAWCRSTASPNTCQSQTPKRRRKTSSGSRSTTTGLSPYCPRVASLSVLWRLKSRRRKPLAHMRSYFGLSGFP
jgi:hypothetical protein